MLGKKRGAGDGYSSPTLIVAALLLAACSRTGLERGAPDGDVTTHVPVCGPGPQLGDESCKTCWDHGVVVADDGMNQAFLPTCGNSNCLPIVTSGHPEPSYAPPQSTCDLLPDEVLSTCPQPFDCTCLQPLLSQFKVWPPTKWNCEWFCSELDGGIRLHCSLP